MRHALNDYRTNCYICEGYCVIILIVWYQNGQQGAFLYFWQCLTFSRTTAPHLPQIEFLWRGVGKREHYLYLVQGISQRNVFVSVGGSYNTGIACPPLQFFTTFWMCILIRDTYWCAFKHYRLNKFRNHILDGFDMFWLRESPDFPNKKMIKTTSKARSVLT